MMPAKLVLSAISMLTDTVSQFLGFRDEFFP